MDLTAVHVGRCTDGLSFSTATSYRKTSLCGLDSPSFRAICCKRWEVLVSNPRLCSGPFICGAVCGCYNAFINMDSPSQNYICITSNDSSSFKVPVELKICLLIFVFLPFRLCCLFKILFLPPL